MSERPRKLTLEWRRADRGSKIYLEAEGQPWRGIARRARALPRS